MCVEEGSPRGGGGQSWTNARELREAALVTTITASYSSNVARERGPRRLRRWLPPLTGQLIVDFNGQHKHSTGYTLLQASGSGLLFAIVCLATSVLCIDSMAGKGPHIVYPLSLLYPQLLLGDSQCHLFSVLYVRNSCCCYCRHRRCCCRCWRQCPHRRRQDSAPLGFTSLQMDLH